MFLYSVAFRLYIFVVYLAAFFNPKAQKLITGRRNFFRLHQPDPTVSFIWFHCASLGEFEQARPLIEKIKKEQPSKKILLSFFSSSGYEVRKNYALADQVIYLPFDSRSNAKKFLKTFNISMAVFVKYDVWPFYLKELFAKNIPVFLISATFRKNQFYFKWYGKFMEDLLKNMNHIFVQDKDSLMLLEQKNFGNASQCGDVRVDRVIQIHSDDRSLNEIEVFTSGEDCFVFGSVYPDEINLIKQFSTDVQCRIIIAPHTVEKKNIDVFLRNFPDSILWSELNNYSGQRFLIIDNIGMLSKIYKYGIGAYIGGGFGKGIHNILEPAIWGIPVYFGPLFHKFPEAISLIDQKIGFSEKTRVELAKIMSSNTKEFDRVAFKKLSASWFKVNSGATDLIYNMLSDFI
jgi:3-deoxy-D-manno-octulosonic-acid transferase